MVRAVRGEARARLVLELEDAEKRGASRHKGLPKAASDLVRRAREERVFRGRNGEVTTLLLSDRSALKTLVLLGLGSRKRSSLDSFRRAFGSFARQAPPGEIRLDLSDSALRDAAKSLGWERLTRAIVEGALLGAYRYEEFKSAKSSSAAKRGAKKKGAPSKLVLEADALSAPDARRARRGAELGQAAAEAIAFARDLGNTPANELSPAALAARARAMARRHGLTCRVLDESALRRESMGAMLAVAQGSARAPRLIIVEHRPRAARRT
ncbi:MAG TPA: M17 family peptidase N-terminal domain-containing protein, partial [Planctomycetota bacterium]|nr:M17 family peptidase N-terminal domain-containing protein [Planctomycetota bacterium]